MTVYRFRAVLLLFLVLHLTACYTWQGVATTSPAELIEATQPDRVRLTVRRESGLGLVELANPSVESDQLVGADGISIPLEDIVSLEVRRVSMERTVPLAVTIISGIRLAICLTINPCQS